MCSYHILMWFLLQVSCGNLFTACIDSHGQFTLYKMSMHYIWHVTTIQGVYTRGAVMSSASWASAADRNTSIHIQYTTHTHTHTHTHTRAMYSCLFYAIHCIYITCTDCALCLLCWHSKAVHYVAYVSSEKLWPHEVMTRHHVKKVRSCLCLCLYVHISICLYYGYTISVQ